MKSFRKQNCSMRWNHETKNARKFLVSGALLFLGFSFPCLGVAQEHTEIFEPSLAEEPQVAVDDLSTTSEAPAEVEEDPIVDAAPQEFPVELSPEVGVQVPAPNPECYGSSQPEQSCSSPSPLLGESSEKPCQKERICWPSAHGSITFEFLYLKSVLENLRYGMKLPQEANLYPVCANIEQPFNYDPAGRLSLGVTVDDFWQFNAIWTYYEASPSAVSAFNDEYGIFANMATSAYLSTGNPMCQNLNGKWNMKMNVIDVEFKKPFCIGKSLMFAPVIGVQGALFKQNLRVDYRNYRIDDAPATTPETVKGTSKIWAVGPEIAIESRFLAQRKFDLFVRASYSAMAGLFKANIYYSNMLLVSEGYITVRDESRRIFSMWQIQAAISKRWNIGKGLIEFMLGWETQFWTGINRWDYFGTFAVPSSSGNLMLAGPFARLSINF